MRNEEIGLSRGMLEVALADEQAVNIAIEECSQAELDGRTLTVRAFLQGSNVSF